MTTIDIVGGGILGLTLGYRLLQRGLGVRIWEGGPSLGGLMGRTHFPDLDGLTVDRYYHAILSSDQALTGLIGELGLAHDLHAVTTRMGFYHDQQLYPMSAPLDFLRFPPLSLRDRARLAYTILQARRIRDWRRLEQVPVLEWLTRLGGPGPVAHIWQPLLRAKFDGSFAEVPATYIWARLVRMTDTRSKTSAKEQMCYLTGGYQQLIDALAARIRALGGTITLGARVAQVQLADGQVRGLALDGQVLPSEGAVLTLQTPLARRLLPPGAAAVDTQWRQLEAYLGIVCVLLVLRRSLTPYYTLNITDDRIPFTGVIETTNLIDRRLTGGYHLVYLPKYVSAGNPFAQLDDAGLTAAFLGYLRGMFPELRAEEVAGVRVGRERYVEPLHPLGRTEAIPPVVTPGVGGLYLVNSAQIYPQLTNGEAAVRHAQQAAEQVIAAQATTLIQASRDGLKVEAAPRPIGSNA